MTSAAEVVTSVRLPETSRDVEPPSANPFLAPSAPLSEPSVELASNPFLAEPAPARALAPEPEPVRRIPSTPRDASKLGAPLRVDPSVALPNIRDPHAEFRRGAWKKPLAFVALGAALLFGLSQLGGEKPASPRADLGEPVKVRAGIGTSLPPHRTTEEPALGAAEAKEAPEDSGAVAPSGQDLGRSREAAGESNFAKAFKEAAKR